jgi:Uma2 family endonuclease
MSHEAQTASLFTVKEYFDLVESGEIGPDDRVELLEGVIVALSPQSPRHAVAIHRVEEALRRVLQDRGLVWGQTPLRLGDRSVPEPDVMVIAGRIEDYETMHPTVARLVVEVAESSLQQDRLSKSRIYARNGVPEFWIVNLRDEIVEVRRQPQFDTACYQETFTARRGERLELVAFPGAGVAVEALLPTVSDS